MRVFIAIVLSLALASLGIGPLPALAAGDKAPSAAVSEKGEKMTMDQVPAAVKATIEKEAKGGSVVDVTKETEKGKTTYEARIMKGGKEQYVHVADSGKVTKRESAKSEAKTEAKEEKKAEKSSTK